MGAFANPHSDNNADQGACSGNLLSPTFGVDSVSGMQIFNFVFQTLSLDNIDKDLSVGSVGFAVYYTLPTPPTQPTATLTLVDPYLVSPVQSSMSASVIAQLGSLTPPRRHYC
jgi:hypothetical protein